MKNALFRRPAEFGVVRRAVTLWLIAFVTLGSPWLSAATYFVSPTGDDTRSAAMAANAATPWKTLTRALDGTSVADSVPNPELMAGDVINVAAGTYNTASGENYPLFLVDGVQVIGAGAATTILSPPQFSPAFQNFSGLLSGTTRLSGFTLVHEGLSPFGGLVRFHLGDFSMAPRIDNNIFQGSPTGFDAGINYQDGFGTGQFTALIENNTFTGFSVGGIVGTQASGGTAGDVYSPTIRNNNFTMNAVGIGHAIGFGEVGSGAGTTAPVITGNTFSGNLSNDILFNFTLLDEFVRLGPTISNNSFTGTGGPAISFNGDFSSGTYTVDPVISGNTITDAMGNAIDFTISAFDAGAGDKTFSPTITGNIITNAASSGIEVEMSEISLTAASTLIYSPTITNNSITNPGNNGLELSLSLSSSGNLVANYIITGNTITNAGSDGISLSINGECCRSVFDVAITIANNTIDGSGSDGMSLSFSSLTGNDSGKFDLAVTGNTITNSGSDGISLSAGGYTGSAIPQTILVDGNTITGSGSQGISLSITDQTSLISNDIRITNNILNNNNVGLSVFSDGWMVAGVPANAVLVSCNTVTGNATAGIQQSSLSFALPADYGGGDRGSLGRNQIRNNGPGGNGLFDFMNFDDQPVKAEQNFWGTTDPAVIDSHISDNEEAGTGAVDFDPFLFVATSCAPADLSLTKTDSPDPVAPNSTLTYTLTVTNSGPGAATSVTVTDTLPAGVTFVSASGAGFSCSQAGGVVTCTSASMAASTIATITIVVTTPTTAATLTNNASVSSASPDPVAGNNAASATTSMAGAVCPDRPTGMNPPSGATNVPTSGRLSWARGNADSFTVFLGEGDAGCFTQVATTNFNFFDYSNLKGGTVYRWRIGARKAGCPNVVLGPCFYLVTAQASCNNPPPVLLEPPGGATDLVSPITFRWTAVLNAGVTGYQVFFSVNGGADQLLGTTTGQNTTSLTADVPTGQIDWFVLPIIQGCIAVASARATFNASNCRPPGTTIASSHPNVYDDTDYLTLWEPVEGAVKYIVFESLPNRCQGPEKPDASCFEGARQFEVPAPQIQLSLRNDVDRPTKFHYLVVAEGCQGKRGNASKITTTVVDTNPFHITAALGYQKDIRTSFVINETGVGKSALQTGFTASSDKGFLTVTPSSGTIPPAGTTLTVTANPRGLPVGSTTGTVTVTNSNTGAVIANVPISLSLVTPVTPVAKGTPPPNALIIPAVSHIEGSNSSWQTDTAVVNTSGIKLQYQFAFTPSGEDGTQEGKKTVIDVESGQTVTFKDLVKVLFGQGSLNDGQNGALDIRPLNFEGKLTPEAVKLATIASSRTYNDAPTGSVGQFVRGIAFSEFIGKATEGKSAVLSMQHVAQSASFRTNLGLVEGKGETATVVVRAFNNAGLKIHESTVDLRPFEHRQLNSFLTTQGIGLEDGRMEVEVTSSTGRITAYASVVDNLSTDPILVPGVNTTKLLSTKYAIPGVADLTTATNNWRTDLRVFNGGTAPVTATLQYFKQNEATAAKTAQLSIAPGEVKAVDNLLQSLFGEVNSGGVVHISTPGPSSLVASARTYDRRANGTLGQLVEAVTPDDAFGATDRALQILQIEESPRFRSNLGVVEVSGNPATVEVSASQPDSKVETKISLQLRANEFMQFPAILKQLNLGTTYYGRIAVRVVSGDGKVSGYGSVIDNLSQDPTFVNGQ